MASRLPRSDQPPPPRYVPTPAKPPWVPPASRAAAATPSDDDDPARTLQLEILRELLAILRENGTKSALRNMLRSDDPKTQERGFGMLFDGIAKLSSLTTKSERESGGGGALNIHFGDVPRPVLGDPGPDARTSAGMPPMNEPDA